MVYLQIESDAILRQISNGVGFRIIPQTVPTMCDCELCQYFLEISHKLTALLQFSPLFGTTSGIKAISHDYGFSLTKYHLGLPWHFPRPLVSSNPMVVLLRFTLSNGLHNRGFLWYHGLQISQHFLLEWIILKYLWSNDTICVLFSVFNCQHNSSTILFDACCSQYSRFKNIYFSTVEPYESIWS